MNIIKYNDILTVEEAIEKNEPLFAVISFDGEDAIVAHADEAVEHNILLKKAGKSGNDIDIINLIENSNNSHGELVNFQQVDKYFRIVFDKDGADWTFVCPPDYKNISDKQRRIAQFYKDGFTAISNFLAEFGYFSDINIPHRYDTELRSVRHFNIMNEE